MSRRGSLKDESGATSDYQRPRRPNEDTLAYIKSLPLNIKQASEEIGRFRCKEGEATPGNGDNYPNLYAAALSALEEVQGEIASLAGDEGGSECLETLARILIPCSELAARKLLAGCSGYYLHLSTHRYGSHVVQTILQLSNVSSEHEDLAKEILDEDQYLEDQKKLPLLSHLILGVAEEVLPSVQQLAVHVCGSHVLRTLLCVFSGIDLRAAPGSGDIPAENGSIRRGRVKMKKKKKKSSESDTLPSHAGLMRMVYRHPSNLRISVQNEDFTQALVSLAEELSGNSVTKFVVHPSAGPLLVVLLRVLSYVSCEAKGEWQEGSERTKHEMEERQLGMLVPQPKFQLGSAANKLAMKILCWPETESEDTKSVVSNVIYGLAGEPRGSHMLEALFQVSPDSFYEALLKYGDFYNRSTLQEYIDDPVSNFVVQTLLSTVRNKEQAEALLRALSPIIASGSVIDSTKKRRGILWKTAEMAAKHHVGQDGLLKSIRVGFGVLQDRSVQELEEEQAVSKKKRRKASTVDFADCVHKLLDAKIDEGSNGRVAVDVAGARTVHFLLRFSPRLCEDTINGILSYEPEMLVKFAKDGLASRCVWDGILDGPTESQCFRQGLQKLRELLGGQWVALSCDRVGQHVVKKIFRVSPEAEKVKIVEELAKSIPRLSGSAMGRSVIDICAVREFSEGTEAWNSAVRKACMQENWLNDVLKRDDKIRAARKLNSAENENPKKKQKPSKSSQ